MPFCLKSCIKAKHVNEGAGEAGVEQKASLMCSQFITSLIKQAHKRLCWIEVTSSGWLSPACYSVVEDVVAYFWGITRMLVLNIKAVFICIYFHFSFLIPHIYYWYLPVISHSVIAVWCAYYSNFLLCVCSFDALLLDIKASFHQMMALLILAHCQHQH